MTIEIAQSFITKVQTDESLRAEVIALGQDFDGLVRMAAAHGYSFNADDLKAAAQNAGYATGQTINEDELINVAGGACGVNTGNASTIWTQSGCC